MGENGMGYGRAPARFSTIPRAHGATGHWGLCMHVGTGLERGGQTAQHHLERLNGPGTPRDGIGSSASTAANRRSDSSFPRQYTAAAGISWDHCRGGHRS